VTIATKITLLALLGIIYAAFLTGTVSGQAILGYGHPGQPRPGLFPDGRSSG
jgi:hypothetical protein